MGFLSDLFGGKNGPVGTYYSNGQLEIKATYVAGEREGPSESYYENGQLKWKGTYNSELGDWRFGELVGEIS